MFDVLLSVELSGVGLGTWPHLGVAAGKVVDNAKRVRVLFAFCCSNVDDVDGDGVPTNAGVSQSTPLSPRKKSA